MTRRADRYWQAYLASLPPEVERPARYVEAFSFGFTPCDATEIAGLVLAGIKTATGSVLWSYEADGKPLPKRGDHWVVNDGSGAPVCVIRTLDVAILPYDEVPECWAREGGEADRTLATWRDMYWRYIVSECRRIGREPDVKAPLVMERFRVVFPSAIQLREATAEDLQLLAELNRQLIQDQRSENPMSLDELRERMRGWLATEYRAVLFESASVPVAYAVFRTVEGGIHLRQFFVLRGLRRRRIGHRAIEAFRERYVPPGAPLTLEVLVHNETGIAFWRALGFREYALSMRLAPEGKG